MNVGAGEKAGERGIGRHPPVQRGCAFSGNQSAGIKELAPGRLAIGIERLGERAFGDMKVDTSPIRRPPGYRRNQP